MPYAARTPRVSSGQRFLVFVIALLAVAALGILAALYIK
jgi:hypothetical protein